MKRSVRGAVCVLVMFCLGIMYSWSILKVALETEFPQWTQVQITLNFTIMISCYSLGAFLAAVCMRRIDKKNQVRIGAVLLLAGFMGTSFLPGTSGSVWMLYLLYGILVGLGVGMAYNPILSVIPLWFLDKPGLISGVLLMGMGFGSLLLGNAADRLISLIGLSQTFRILAVVIFAVVFFGAAVIRVPKEEEKTHPGADSNRSVVPVDSISPKEMLRRPTFWLYFIWIILISSAGMLVLNSASSIAIYFGMSAVLGLLVSIFNGFGRVLLGNSMDRFGWKKTLLINNGIVLLGGAVLLTGDALHSSIAILVGMLAMGISYGGGAVISISLARSLYGNRYFSQNAAIINLCLIPSAIIGPVIAAWMQDNFGGYTSMFIMAIVFGLVALIINLFMRQP